MKYLCKRLSWQLAKGCLQWTGCESNPQPLGCESDTLPITAPTKNAHGTALQNVSNYKLPSGC